jgi:ATP-dependent RNA helicase DHX8/PRP22
MKSGQLAKDRKDIREQQQRAINEALPKDLNKLRDDPTVNPAVRNLAQSLPNPYDLPEWKKDSLVKTSSQPVRS